MHKKGIFIRKSEEEGKSERGKERTEEKEEEEAEVVEKEKRISKKRWEGDLHPTQCL